MKRLRDKVNNDMFVEYWRVGSKWPLLPPPFVGASGTYSRIITYSSVFIVVFEYIDLAECQQWKHQKMCETKCPNTDQKNLNIWTHFTQWYWQLIVKVPEWLQWFYIGVFIVNFEHISHIILVFPLLANIEELNID